METKKKLVLLSTFSESPESLPAFLLCIKLVKKGHHVLVTTTSTGDYLKAEEERAKQLTEKYDGRIELLQPNYRGYETPSPEWIQNLPKQYFSYLMETNADCIYGTLPGTAQTAIELKDSLKQKCQVVLLATCELGSSEQDLRSDIIKSATAADEVWSMGPDIYTHYKDMFRAEPQIPNQDMVFMPDIDPATFWKQHQKAQINETGTLVSIWNPPVEFFHYGTKTYSRGRDIESYYALSTALGEINAAYNVDKVEWNVYDLEKNDHKSHDLQNHAKPHMLKVTPLGVKTSISSLPWADCLAFIAPDQEEETFNFFALTAIWLGIPTLVSSQSSIGKFLLTLPCSEKFRAVVNLTGDPKLDTAKWNKRINDELLSTSANSQQWTATLSKYLQMNQNVWEPHFMSFYGSRDYPATLDKTLRPQSPTSDHQGLITTQVLRQYAKSGKERRELDESDVNDCSQHTGTAITLYCNKCQYPVCGICIVDAHNSHPTMQITEKYQEMASKLTALLKVCYAQEENVKRQQIEIMNNKFDIETSTERAIEEMKQQRLIVDQDVLKSFEEQINMIKRTKEKELTEFDAHNIRLQQHERHRKAIENNARTLTGIGGSKTPNFIIEASTFLNFNQLTEVPAKKGNIGEKRLYRHPVSKWIQDPGKRRIYVENQILVYFATEDEERKRHFKELDMPAEAEMGDLKRFDSTRSVGADSEATYISATSRMFGLSRGTSQWSLPNIVKGQSGPVEFISSTHVRIFEGSSLKAFSSILFSDNTLWISGWNRNLIGTKTTVLLNVDLLEYNILKKEKKTNSNADMPTTIVHFDDKIIFTIKSGKEVFSFNPERSTFKSIYSRPNLKVAAMCSADNRIFLLNQKEPKFIHIFNNKFQLEEKVTTGLWDL